MDLSYLSFHWKKKHAYKSPMQSYDGTTQVKGRQKKIKIQKKIKKLLLFIYFFTKYPLCFITHYWSPPSPFFPNYSLKLPIFSILFYYIFLIITLDHYSIRNTISPIPNYCWKLPMSPPTNFLYFNFAK